MGVHRFAVATALATLLLIVAGGLVSTTESGLACPDWPLCEGRYIPEMRDGKQFEHTHRLIGAFVATMTFGLTALLWKHRRGDKLLTKLGTVTSLGVTIQALLGAMTVWLQLPAWTSSTHLAVAMAFFAVAVTLAFLTRQRMPGVEVEGIAPSARPRVLRFWAVAMVLVYLQIVGGAVMRHTRGGLVCGYELLTCLGEVWPAHPFIGVQAHMVHRYLGVAAGLGVIAFAVVLYRAAAGRDLLQWLAMGLGGGVAAQVGLGIWTILSSRDLTIMNTHSTVAALLLAGMFSAYWLIAPSRAPAAQTSPVDAAPVSGGSTAGQAVVA